MIISCNRRNHLYFSQNVDELCISTYIKLRLPRIRFNEFRYFSLNPQTLYNSSKIETVARIRIFIGHVVLYNIIIYDVSC